MKLGKGIWIRGFAIFFVVMQRRNIGSRTADNAVLILDFVSSRCVDVEFNMHNMMQVRQIYV